MPACLPLFEPSSKLQCTKCHWVLQIGMCVFCVRHHEQCSRRCRQRDEDQHGKLSWCMRPFLQWGCPLRIRCCVIMHVHAMGMLLKAKVSSRWMVFHKKDRWLRSKPVCRLIYVCVCSGFCFFVTTKVTTRWIPCNYMYVLISIEMYIYVYPWPVNIVTINYIVLCYF